MENLETVINKILEASDFFDEDDIEELTEWLRQTFRALPDNKREVLRSELNELSKSEFPRFYNDIKDMDDDEIQDMISVFGTLVLVALPLLAELANEANAN